jgi:hypothetical protein
MDGSFQIAGTIRRGVLKGLAVRADPCALDRQIVMVSGRSGVFLEIASDSLSIDSASPTSTSREACDGDNPAVASIQ